ncbi:MAG TPA: PEP/pyruvate-binding domain-containing protein [Bacteroidales bacterium]|nr:PEP/pyruvate-binding domain-containing protein [Bacteroidales bacterium]
MIKFLDEIENEPAGGKARGLKILRELGMRVPEAFVLIHPDAGSLDEDLLRKCLQSLGAGPKAVRSSAVSEDGHQASFAGQFETYLNLSSFEEVREAILKCIKAADSERVKAYSGNLTGEADLRVSVIVQNMVDARTAGVVFSVNPVTNRHDKMVINAVAGHCDELVSGKKDAHHYEIFRSGSDLEKAREHNGKLLSASQLREILEGTLKAEKEFRVPVDLEWAIDPDGVLNWLQVRPVTTLSEVHLNELDTVKEPCTDIWTLGNIGEMMPGVATPLTYSVSAEAIDYGMCVLADKTGAYPMAKRTGYRYIQMFYNRLFINMSHMMDYPKNIWLNKSEDVQFALSSKVPYEMDTTFESRLPRRVWNFYRQVRLTSRAGYHLKKLIRLEKDFHLDPGGDQYQLYNQLDHSLPRLREGFAHHLITSGQSGSLYSAFIRILTGDKRAPDASDHHIATQLLLNIPEIESADAVKSLERFAGQIRGEPAFAGRFTGVSPEEALKILRNEAPDPIRTSFLEFLKRHGHRCVRESELREKPWEENPVRLIQILQLKVKSDKILHTHPDATVEIRKALHHLPFLKRMILRALIPVSRKAVARREISKAYSIRILNRIRQGYKALAAILVQEHLLDDPDQIYFLTHPEIRKLILEPDPAWKAKASRRRELLPECDRLEFPEVSRGIPEPIENGDRMMPEDGQLTGIPVSSGTVTGRVRIIHTLEEADRLQEGEIMVASFTDIGWTPYFSVISGLITEIGSPLSHGAVVAREYGIPAVVGVKGARNLLRDGEEILLDADRGIIEKVNHPK